MVYTPNFIEIGQTLWTDIRTYLLTDGHFPLLMFGGVDLKSKQHKNKIV